MRYHTNNDSPPWPFVVFLIVLLIILWFIESCNSSSAYNSGICRDCGGRYEFQNAVGHKYSTNYVYKCNECGNLIETNSYYNAFDSN